MHSCALCTECKSCNWALCTAEFSRGFAHSVLSACTVCGVGEDATLIPREAEGLRRVLALFGLTAGSRLRTLQLQDQVGQLLVLLLVLEQAGGHLGRAWVFGLLLGQWLVPGLVVVPSFVVLRRCGELDWFPTELWAAECPSSRLRRGRPVLRLGLASWGQTSVCLISML